MTPDTPSPLPDPNILTVYALTEGFVIQYQGKTLASNTPAATGKTLVRILNSIVKTRAAAPEHLVYGAPQPVAAPAPPPPGMATPPATAPGPMSQPDPAIGSKNLDILVQNRVSGKISDREFWDFVSAGWIAPLTEDDATDRLDRVFEQAPAPWVPDEDSPESQQVQPATMPVNMPVPASTSGSRLPDDPQLIDLSPAQMVDDWIVDDSTGELLPDGSE